MYSYLELESLKNLPAKVELILHEKGLEVQTILVKGSEREKGFGTAIMTEIIGYCDKNKLNSFLIPDETLGSTIGRLRKFYKRFGFKSVPCKKAMIRKYKR